jgi:hypothetical protein
LVVSCSLEPYDGLLILTDEALGTRELRLGCMGLGTRVLELTCHMREERVGDGRRWLRRCGEEMGGDGRGWEEMAGEGRDGG